jgi:hypothetical protein
LSGHIRTIRLERGARTRDRAQLPEREARAQQHKPQRIQQAERKEQPQRESRGQSKGKGKDRDDNG